ncbi:undecaprenyl/decaprenyl-phosphate alpha-N-acetylglucosaminyl 1-phosphate transferase [Patescibacteria group bacterium]|nr:undecaprenyl/decaprenyl-phosphate alpha-N-acetylglucosaminyl 1-phosphate transferase [Patescibacteria group bacterium]
MLDPKPYLLPFFLALGLSLLFTPLVKVIAQKFGFVDLPDKRKVHKKITARLGGLAIFLSFAIVTLIFYFFKKDFFVFAPWHEYNLPVKFTGIIIGALVLIIVGIIDDKKTLSPWTKLGAQIIAALIVIISGTRIEYVNNPLGGFINFDLTVSYLISLVWIVGIINVINFLDGLDGLAAGVSFFASISIFFISLLLTVYQPATAFLSIVLAGALLGFLPFNFNPAKIFMGDSGSLFLGYVLAILSIVSGAKMATALLVLGFPIIDGLWVVARRIARSESPFKPDKTHLHHRLLSIGLSVRGAVILLWMVSLIFGMLGIISTTYGKMISIILLIVIMFFVYTFLYYFERRRECPSG